MKTIAEIVAECTPAPVAIRHVQPDEIDLAVEQHGIRAYPFWVVVVNPRRQPPRPKQVTGHKTAEEAKAEAVRRQAQADKDAAVETANREWLEEKHAKEQKRDKRPVPPFAPFRFFAVARPDDIGGAA